MKNSKGFVLVILVIAVAFTALNIMAISKTVNNPLAKTSQCTAQGDFMPKSFSAPVAEQTPSTLICTTGDIKPRPWSDFYPVKKKTVSVSSSA